MATSKGVTKRKYKRSVNRYYKKITKRKKRGCKTPIKKRDWLDKLIKDLIG